MPQYRELYHNPPEPTRRGSVQEFESDEQAIAWFIARSAGIAYEHERLVWDRPPAEGSLIQCHTEHRDTGVTTFIAWLVTADSYVDGEVPGRNRPRPTPPPPPPPDPRMSLDRVYDGTTWKDD